MSCNRVGIICVQLSISRESIALHRSFENLSYMYLVSVLISQVCQWTKGYFQNGQGSLGGGDTSVRILFRAWAYYGNGGKTFLWPDLIRNEKIKHGHYILLLRIKKIFNRVVHTGLCPMAVRNKGCIDVVMGELGT